MRPRIAILDYGMGNLRSVAKALEHVGAAPELTADHRRVREADGVVLPGVGAMPRAMEQVRRLGLDELMRERVGAGVPAIGVCMGMQLLFDSTTELGGAEGIGLIPGPVAELAAQGLKVPQIGWNSFAPRPADPEHVLGTADYGSEFVSAVARPPLYGVQFHPEKSGPDGLRLLGNFVRSCVPVAA